MYYDFKLEPDRRQPLVYDEKAVIQNIKMLLSTEFGERFFEPHICAELGEALFELIDEDTADFILNRVINAISAYEDRVLMDYANCEVVPNYENNRYDVVLAFRIKGLEGQTFSTEISLGGS